MKRIIQNIGIGMLISMTTTNTLAQSEASTDSSKSDKVSFRPIKLSSNSVIDYSGSFGTTAKKEDAKETLFSDMKLSGVFRFVTIYRNMEKSYEDMQTSDKNISFLDYPLTDIASSGGVGNPILALALTSKVRRSGFFRISYSIAHSFTGSPDNNVNKFYASNGGLAFEGNLKTNPVKVNLKFGGLLTMKVSRLVFDAPKYRNNFFDRLVSNKYSVSKQESLYARDDDGRSFLWPYVRGGIARLTFPDLKNTELMLMYGRSGRTIFGLDAIDGFPAINYLTRISKPMRFGRRRGVFALNYYMKDADTDPINRIRDDVQLVSTDINLKWNDKIRFTSEIGASKVTNPLITDPTWGTAVIVNAITTKKLLPIPLDIEYYNIGHDYGNVDGEVLNSNINIKDGGVTSTGETDQSLFVNVAQEVGLIANNRAGFSLQSNFEIGKLKVELGYGVSQEKENIYDTITFQHRVNGFSRSRFWQWRQGIGPYNRIRSIYARTFEMMSITDADSGISTNYKKGFNNIEMLLKYQIELAKIRFTIVNFNNFSSIQDGFSISPVFSDQAFIRTFYEDITVFARINRKFMLLANYGLEKAWGNDRLNLSTDNPTAPVADRVLDQTGWAAGFGFGYDITTKMSIHFRHKWMSHKDKNFVLDEFKGQESTIELKMNL